METILIVDDHPLVFMTIKELLKTQLPDVIFITAKNGADALHLVRNNLIDLIITDVNMPVMGGVELAEKVKGEYPEIFVILMGGEPEPIGNVADYFIAKPIAYPSLYQMVKYFLKIPEFITQEGE